MNTTDARNLRQIRLVMAETSVSPAVTIREGESLTSVVAASYRAGWILREVDAAGRLVRAYQRDKRGDER
jgi:hypothetical protein